MSALIKKDSGDKRILELTSDGSRPGRDPGRLIVVDRVRPNGCEIDFVIEKVWDDSPRSTLLFKIKHVQDLDDMIIALTAVRETYK